MSDELKTQLLFNTNLIMNMVPIVAKIDPEFIVNVEKIWDIMTDRLNIEDGEGYMKDLKEVIK